MTTNTTHSVPAGPVDGRFRTSRWLPRSDAAACVLLLTGAAAAWPAVLAGLWSWINATGCFFDCLDPDPIEAFALGVIAVLLLVSPFAAVRFLQSAVAPARVRFGIVLLLDAAGLAFTVWWFWPS